MKTMIYTLAYTALLSIALSSCNDDNAPILTQKDWDNTATYFKPTEYVWHLLQTATGLRR